ncbi:phosphoadenosine phosphosulfate reductase [Vreelandella neptunia]|uniref:phosphoadenosine phosphosulfate reductase n=1 Tax=Vreelandella neptunia TaxID=115551 RepID=UPI003159C813
MSEPSIKELVKAGALFVANHSGGKDSDAQLIKIRSVVPASQLLVVHASLGKFEWPGALELAEQRALSAGLPFIVARASKSMFDMVLRRFEKRPEVPSWPSSSTRQCTSDLKRGPIQREVRRYAKANGFKLVVNCLGFREQESPARRKRKVLSKMGISNSVLTWYEWLPIHQMKVEEVFWSILGAGQQPHYAYGLKIIDGKPVATKNSRLSCVFCLFGSANDIKHGGREHPELLAEYDAMEKRTGYTMHMSRVPLIEIVGVAA